MHFGIIFFFFCINLVFLDHICDVLLVQLAVVTFDLVSRVKDK